jgi:NAD(P)-dependent dehydrogenase (short-subunit alcohol dehydrogenase family)
MIESINPSTVVHSIAVDISDHHAVKRAFDEISELLGARTPQVLVNNAGVISSQTPMVDDDPDFWCRTQVRVSLFRSGYGKSASTYDKD